METTKTITKRLLAIMLSLAMVFSLMGANVFNASAEIEASGDLVFKPLADGTLEITGLLKPQTKLIIPSKINGKTVTSISDNAFEDWGSFTSITIGKSVKNIGENTFDGCDLLKSIDVEEGNANYSSLNGVLFNKDKTTLIKYPEGKTDSSYVVPNSVKSIYAFSSYKLTSIVIPDSVANIGVFDCGSLKNIDVAEKNANYSSLNGVLFNKNKTTLVKYPAGKTDSSYTIPDSVTSIGACAFDGCKSLKTVTIGNGVESIGNYAFSSCSLTSIVIPDSVKSIGNGAFSRTGLTSIVIPDSVESIGNSAFYWSGLTSIVIPDSVKSIGDEAFYDCDSLKSVTIGNGVKSIGKDAFLIANR